MILPGLPGLPAFLLKSLGESFSNSRKRAPGSHSVGYSERRPENNLAPVKSTGARFPDRCESARDRDPRGCVGRVGQVDQSSDDEEPLRRDEECLNVTRARIANGHRIA